MQQVGRCSGVALDSSPSRADSKPSPRLSQRPFRLTECDASLHGKAAATHPLKWEPESSMTGAGGLATPSLFWKPEMRRQHHCCGDASWGQTVQAGSHSTSLAGWEKKAGAQDPSMQGIGKEPTAKYTCLASCELIFHGEHRTALAAVTQSTCQDMASPSKTTERNQNQRGVVKHLPGPSAGNQPFVPGNDAAHQTCASQMALRLRLPVPSQKASGGHEHCIPTTSTCSLGPRPWGASRHRGS